MFLQKHAKLFHISTKGQGRHDRSGHHFGVAHLALSILVMAQSYQNIGTNICEIILVDNSSSDEEARNPQ